MTDVIDEFIRRCFNLSIRNCAVLICIEQCQLPGCAVSSTADEIDVTGKIIFEFVVCSLDA